MTTLTESANPTTSAAEGGGDHRVAGVDQRRSLWEPYRFRRLVEPCCGGLAVTPGLMPARALLNDINPHAVNFYGWLKKGLQVTIPMRNEASVYYTHRERFNKLIAQGEADSQEAAELFYYLNRTGYNGLCRFNVMASSMCHSASTRELAMSHELKEDYPWVDLLMKPSEGLIVPCTFEEVVDRWGKGQILEGIRMRIEAQEERLPPAHLEEGPDGARKDLEELGIFARMKDDRVNIRDVLRVGYGLGRRGGVKPIRKGEDA